MYRLLDRVSPLSDDCGKLCGACCCTAEGAGDMGMYLLPGEEKIHEPGEDWLIWQKERAEDYDFPDSWHGPVYFVRCKTPPVCPREKRPLQCRTFPLTPHLYADETLELLYNDLDLPYRCPLIEQEIPLDERFVRATYTVWKHLIRDPLIRDLVRKDSEERETAFLELQEKLKKADPLK